MNKEQLLAIIQGGHLTDGDLADALLAELAKVQEPVAMYCGYNPSMGHVFRADAVIEVGTYLYTQPPQQPDLVAEIERLRLENAAMKAEWEKAYEIGMLAKQQLSAAQAREAELLKALEKIVEDSKDTRLSSMPHLGRTASKAIYSHKERKDRK